MTEFIGPIDQCRIRVYNMFSFPMSFRFLTLIAALAAIALQAAAPSDGRPDLQGVWMSNGATPLERPKALEGKPFLTDPEVAELKKRAAQLFKDGSSSD